MSIFARKCHVTDTNAKYIMVILTSIVVLKKLHKDWLQQFRYRKVKVAYGRLSTR
ncbi:hypothetical protein THF5H11_40059 [Vibrio jasicida]|uniref:Transposase n=1 Tax=Vibrio jasicida TaxID=766224 RepID=A0AAU9QHM8_9VIBR|nr:hypothetical protein THF5H11_40059 [Vibrio jasicida]CAH1559648.1 hypothetical protein THF1C08_110011 [Vibrio jasicida]CAH1568331.1 hypothetical protein THF1A12_100011 [Vibrio jasicida]